MALPTDRASFIIYCKRRLGFPVINLEIDEDQISDRVDDAIQKYQEYHFDGIQRLYLIYQVQQQDITNQYFTIVDPLIIGIVRVLPMSQQTINMFDVRYQVRLNDFYNFNNVSMIHYYMTMNHLALLDFLFNVDPEIRFNRKDRQIFVDMDWQSDVTVGSFVVFEVYRAIDPATFSAVWNDMFLKEYATALMKRQWGQNLKKYDKIQLPGGVTLTGQELYEEAMKDIQRLEDDLMTKYELPIDFMIG